MAGFFDTTTPSAPNFAALAGLVDKASASPLTAIGNTMTELDAIATQRGKEQYSSAMADKLKGIKTSKDLMNLGFDPSRGTEAFAKQYENQANQLANIEKLAQEKLMRDQLIKSQEGRYTTSDYAPIDGGMFQKYDIDAVGNRTPVGQPLSQLDMLAAIGVAPAKPESIDTYVDPSNPEATPRLMTATQAAAGGFIPLGDAQSFQKDKATVKYIGTDGKQLDPAINENVTASLAPLVSGDKEAKNAAIKSVTDSLNAWYLPDTYPTVKQEESIKTAIGEMATDPKYGFNLANAISAEAGNEVLSLVNKYNKEKGRPTFEQEPWYERIASEILPFGSEGLETIMPTNDRDAAALYQMQFQDVGGTRPTNGLNSLIK